LQLLHRDPLCGGKDDEYLAKFAQLFQDRGVPQQDEVMKLVNELRGQEGLTQSVGG
jgi:hypothetical protein